MEEENIENKNKQSKILSFKMEGQTIKNIANVTKGQIFTLNGTTARHLGTCTGFEVNKSYKICFNAKLIGVNNKVVFSFDSAWSGVYVPSGGVSIVDGWNIFDISQSVIVEGKTGIVAKGVSINTGCEISDFCIIDGDAVPSSYIPFGLTSTQAIITNNSMKYPFYEPTIQGNTEVVDGKLVSLQPNIEGLADLGSVPSISDVHDLASGKSTLNTKEIVLDSTYSISLHGTDYGSYARFRIAPKVADNLKGSTLFCNNFKNIQIIPSTITEEFIYNHSVDGYYDLFVLKTKASTVEQLKQWLQTNSTTVRYQLATPITQQLTPSQLHAYDIHKRIISLPFAEDKVTLNEDGSADWIESSKCLDLSNGFYSYQTIEKSNQSKNYVARVLGNLYKDTTCRCFCDKLTTLTSLSQMRDNGVLGIMNYTDGNTLYNNIYISLSWEQCGITIDDDLQERVKKVGNWAIDNDLVVIVPNQPTTTHIPSSLCPTVPTYEGINKIEAGSAVKASRFEIGYNERFENNKVKEMCIEGNTVKNLVPMRGVDECITNGEYVEDFYIKYIADGTQKNTIPNLNLNSIKPNTEYTVIVDCKSFSLDRYFGVTLNTSTRPFVTNIPNITSTGVTRTLITSKSDLSGVTQWLNAFIPSTATTGEVIFRLSILEGDYTNTSIETTPFGLSSTQAIITNNGQDYPFYEQTIQGETKVVDANGNECVAGTEGARLVSLEPSIDGLPVLGSVPSTSDVHDLASGVSTLNTKEIVLDGSENWRLASTNRFILNITNIANAKGAVGVVSNALRCVDWSTLQSKDGQNVISSTTDHIGIGTGYATTLQEFQIKLQANPITVRYQLTTPIEIQLTPSQMKAYDNHKRIISLPFADDKLTLNKDGSATWVEDCIEINLSDLIFSNFDTTLPNTYRVSSDVSHLGVMPNSSGMATNFEVIKSGTSNTDTQNICIVGATMYVRVLRNNVDNQSLVGVNGYIKRLNETVVLRRITPTTHTILKEINPPIPIYQTNSLSFGGTVKPSNCSIVLPRHREPITVNFSTPDIQDNINVRVIASNELGENDMANPVNIYVSPQPRWTYLLEENQILLDWQDKFDFEQGYKIQYRINGLDYIYDFVDTTETEGRVQYKFPISPSDTATVRVCCVSDQDHFYSKPIAVSKDRDMTILPPADFTYKWIGEGELEFSWLDNYDCENGFNFEYSIDDGVFQRDFIPSDSVEGGKVYRTVKTLEPYQSISARVKMVWDLNISQHSQLSVIYIPIDAEPIEGVVKSRTDTGILIEWTPQAYVEKYELYYICDGVTTIYETINNVLPLEIDYSNPKQIEIYVISYLTGGAISDKSQSIIFTPTELKHILEGFVHNLTWQEHYIDSAFTHIDTQQLYEIHTKSISNVDTPFYLNTKFLEKYQMEFVPVATTVWQKEAKEFYRMLGLISDVMKVHTENGVLSTFTTHTEQNYIDENIIRTIIRDGYTVNMEINKPRIATMGDSITAGHPSYWAESGTGDVRSQYQYWLSNRLRGGFEILNKGYGRDTSQLLLSRFRRDLEPLNAQFVLVQIGTNDIFEAQKASQNDQATLDIFVANLKTNIVEMVNIARTLGVKPIVGNLIPRTGFKGMYRDALWGFNDWLRDYCNNNSDVGFVDFYNAGKQNIPPTPLESPVEAGAMNEIYDGDTVYDQYGNVVVRGNGIHPNVQG